MINLSSLFHFFQMIEMEKSNKENDEVYRAHRSDCEP